MNKYGNFAFYFCVCGDSGKINSKCHSIKSTELYIIFSLEYPLKMSQINYS